MLTGKPYLNKLFLFWSIIGSTAAASWVFMKCIENTVRWAGSWAWPVFYGSMCFSCVSFPASSNLPLINLLWSIWNSKVGWSRRARVVEASLKTKKGIAKATQGIFTWKQLDDSKMSKIDPQILYNVNPRRWTFGMKSGVGWSPILLIVLTLIITACSSCLFNTLYAKYRRKVGVDQYSCVTEDIPLESNYPIDSDNSDDDWPGFFSSFYLKSSLYISNLKPERWNWNGTSCAVNANHVYVPLVTSLFLNCLVIDCCLRMPWYVRLDVTENCQP